MPKTVLSIRNSLARSWAALTFSLPTFDKKARPISRIALRVYCMAMSPELGEVNIPIKDVESAWTSALQSPLWVAYWSPLRQAIASVVIADAAHMGVPPLSHISPSRVTDTQAAPPRFVLWSQDPSTWMITSGEKEERVPRCTLQNPGGSVGSIHLLNSGTLGEIKELFSWGYGCFSFYVCTNAHIWLLFLMYAYSLIVYWYVIYSFNKILPLPKLLPLF